MSEQQRIDCPVRLVERLRPAQEQIDKLAGEVQAALFGARLALGVPDDWVWDGAGWVEPDNGEDQRHTPENQQNLPES